MPRTATIQLKVLNPGSRGSNPSGRANPFNDLAGRCFLEALALGSRQEAKPGDGWAEPQGSLPAAEEHSREPPASPDEPPSPPPGDVQEKAPPERGQVDPRKLLDTYVDRNRRKLGKSRIGPSWGGAAAPTGSSRGRGRAWRSFRICLAFSTRAISNNSIWPALINPMPRKTRMIILFPSYLQHSVRMYNGERPRVCVPFNARATKRARSNLGFEQPG